MAPALTPEALPGTLCTTLYTGLHVLISLTWGFGTSFVDHGGAASRGLAQASLTIVGVRADRSVPVCPSSPTTPVPGATWGTSRVTALFCPIQSGHQPHYLVPQLFWARGHLCSCSWPCLDLSFLSFTLSSPCSNHQLRIGGLRVTI